MSGNSFGRVLRLTTYGESHGQGIGGILDGCPAGLPITESDIQQELDLRKPGGGGIATTRKESDTVHILSGIFEGQTTGTPIAFHIANEQQRSHDYGNLATLFRPGHADWSYFKKYHGIRDYRGGGRSSGRETAARVAGGAIAKALLKTQGITIYGACIELGGVAIPSSDIDMSTAVQRPYFAASPDAPEHWDRRVAEAQQAKDTLGGIVQILAQGVPAGLGEPVFDKLDAVLAHALMSIGAVKGVEFGEGFNAAWLYGSQNNDCLQPAPYNDLSGRNNFMSNHAGGILGGISSGQDIVIRAAVKPIASLPQAQDTITTEGTATTVLTGGRHDLSAIPRIIPVMTAMTALTLADMLLQQTRMTMLG